MNKLKNYLGSLMLIIYLSLGVNSVYALTINENGTYTTSKGITLSQAQYNKLIERGHEKLIDKFDEGIIKVLSSDNAVIKKDVKVETNDEIFINPNITPYALSPDNNYTSPSKRVEIEYYNDSEGSVIHIYNDWLSMPTIRKYDVIAARWNNNVSGVEIYATQSSNVGDSFYGTTSDHTKITSRGAGVSMNLYNNASSISNELYIYAPTQSAFGNNAYGTYQHARHSNVTLSISKAYTFSSSGYGGVLYWSNSTYRNYFDNMTGVTAL